ncbi:septal ring lytic transglycosylase RlpA family protein [Bradyrhizobium liaoningense]|uniref:septal ring lytic transglycosylase RlpA family protein n=1 Tax=Bradyrhizobium liaoningense TaxID=43992 RepID=UPI001BA448D5|nr:septal ring lytic transglycosylase RlpA family protein [Bradyrhizobium liaoningense]MBR0842232.1 septal ring lytic transglycosylase RlpA family protein [Bradyrhizobium liaoningense]MBR0857982.1 septal ring lytic transglycosylase RlpA family protein [Bradyrhizobium liaoningense]
MSRFARVESARISLVTSCGRPARLLVAIIGAASLAACAQSPVGRQKADLAATGRQAAIERPHRVAALHPRPIRRARPSGDTGSAAKATSHGVASFYSDTETASGEKFDKNELTAAHPSLPFGTKLRVTDVSSGRFVTVRVNDRGPYVRGRVVDISPSAAEALGMVDKGVTNVRLDVVR